MATCFSTHRLGTHEVSMFDLLPAVRDRDVVYLSKNPTDIFYAHKLLPVDSDLHILYLVRDPRAVISSLHWSYDSYFTNFRVWQQCEAHARTLSHHARFHQIRYEELVANPDQCQHYLHARLPFLQQVHPFSGFAQVARLDALAEKAMNGLRPVDTNSLTKWHQHLPRVKSQLQRHPVMQLHLERLGYERNDRWQQLLRDVASVEHSCSDSERSNLLKAAEKSVRVWLKTQRYQQHLADLRLQYEAAAPDAERVLLEVE